eukprot:2595218-Rhodomonas_salina.1
MAQIMRPKSLRGGRIGKRGGRAKPEGKSKDGVRTPCIVLPIHSLVCGTDMAHVASRSHRSQSRADLRGEHCVRSRRCRG